MPESSLSWPGSFMARSVAVTANRRRPRRVMRHMRRIPGYRFARRTMVPRIRHSLTARAVVHRIFDVDAGQHTPLDVTAGNLVAGVGAERLPVVAVIALDIGSAEQLDQLVEEIAELQVLTAGFRPVFVLATPRLGAPRAFGYPVELLTPESEWADEQPWQEYARVTLASIFSVYRTTASLVVSPGGLSSTDRLILASLRP